MKSNKFLHFITGCIILLMVSNVYAAPVAKNDAILFAETKGKELLEIFQENDLEKRYRILDEMILEYLDIKYISKFLVGKYWRMMTPEQKEMYEKLFVRYGLAFYKTLPLEYANNIVYSIEGANIEGEYTNVLANVEFGLGEQVQKITVSFRLHRVSGKIKIVDVKVAESSLLLSYRSKFYEMIVQNDNEIDWFLEELSDITLSMEENLKQKVLLQQKDLEIEYKTR